MRRLPRQQQNFSVRRERDERAFRRLLVLLAGGLLLACGFVVAVGQHFAAVERGYQSEELRRERARLLAEQAQLQLDLDRAAAPANLERAARDIGMQPARAAQMGGMQRADAQRADAERVAAQPARARDKSVRKPRAAEPAAVFVPARAERGR
ncbi:MAG TPA: hypothetical protein VF546_20820 [Pyrinomonadaceae bacterium]|jgi:hypothetical protein